MTSAAPRAATRRAQDNPRDTFFLPSVAIVAAIFFGSWLADQLGAASVVLVLVWAPFLYKYVLSAPPYLAARVLFLLALVLEPPDERPGNGYWVPPFDPASTIFYAGIKKWAGIPGISFSLFSLLCLVLFLRARKKRAEIPPPAEAVTVLKVYAITLAVMEVYGVFLRGGLGQPSYWQLIHPVTLALAAAAFLYSVRGPRDFRAFGTIIVVAAITKGLLVVWVYEVVCRPLNIRPFYATTHSDSVTFAMGIIVCAAAAFEKVDKKILKRALFIIPFIVMAIVMNNRRLAFVGVGAGVITTFAVLRPSKFKRTLTRTMLVLAPVFALYVKVGGTSSNPIFAPAALIHSVLSGEDRSAITRDIENYNLIVTLRENKIFGPGFGAEYIEAVKADDISAGFSLYKFIAHNSVLWLWSLGGLVGFTLLWMMYPMQAFFSARGYRMARTPTERAAGLATLAGTATVLFQDWGDMGFSSYTNVAMFSACYAVAAKLCAATEIPMQRAPGRPSEAPAPHRVETEVVA
ncbi:MAG: O-antigen ligase family protein [Polyangiaceae bacterium]